MEKMTLARGLRYKKRVVESIRQLEQTISEQNSRVAGEEQEADVRLALKQRAEWVKHLLALKLALQDATRPIQVAILELAETKSEIAFLQRMNVTHGMVASRFRDESSIRYEAIIRKGERDKLVRELQDRIDLLQTSIDSFNATNFIEISAPELA